jgi:hypothetical protein
MEGGHAWPEASEIRKTVDQVFIHWDRGELAMIRAGM